MSSIFGFLDVNADICHENEGPTIHHVISQKGAGKSQTLFGQGRVKLEPSVFSHFSRLSFNILYKLNFSKLDYSLILGSQNQSHWV